MVFTTVEKNLEVISCYIIVTMTANERTGGIRLALPWLQMPDEKINIPENQNRRRETGLWS